ncbi:MAG: hypothetical protein KDH86_16340, partial [Anaerolineae bacterium]|nr:hypothetical protein [Anaerolineae bacterium]
RFFGGLGLLALLVSAATFLYLIGLWLVRGAQRRPLFIGAGLLLIAGLLMILVGFVTELIVSQGDRLAELEQEIKSLREE